VVIVVETGALSTVGASVGVSTIEAGTRARAMGDADAALYRDKAARRAEDLRSC
jgi:PleD family two-component response regulator